MSVTFLNQPKLSGHAVNKDQDDRRIALVPKIEQFLLSHKLFSGKDISVSFFQAGASGLVSLVESLEQKFVFKVLLRPDGPKGEVEFLKAWEGVGVSVPHIYESGMIGEHPYILMSYIPAKSLENYSEAELLEKKVFLQMGKILRQIHSTKSVGFGRMKENGVGEYKDFKSWLLEYPPTLNQLKYMQEHNLLPTEEFGSIDDAKEILMAHMGDRVETTYCHWDFAPGNILYTEPLTVFDPVPMYSDPYHDIARSIVQTIGDGYAGPEVSAQFLEGYFSDGLSVDKEVLHAAVLFICHTKMPHWHKIGEEKILNDIRKYLVISKNL